MKGRELTAIWRRELAASFLAPTAYVTMVAFLVASGATFLTGVVRNVGSTEPLSVILFAAITVWLTFVIAVVSMRLFAEERITGTIEPLLTAPVSDWAVVLGKFAAAVTFVWAAMLPAVANIVVFDAVCPGVQFIDFGAIAAGTLMLALLAACLTSVGLLVSLLSGSLIVAAVVSLCAIWGILLLGWLISALPVANAGAALNWSVMHQVAEFSRGIVDSRVVVLYASATILFLFIAARVLAARRLK